MPTQPITQAQVLNLSAGIDLNRRVEYGIEFYVFSAYWPAQTPSDRLRRDLGFPPTHPHALPTYAGIDFSADVDAITDVIEHFSLIYTGTDDAVSRCTWFVTQAMGELGMS